MCSLISIFTTFLKIGAFTIGGAYAMIPLIRREVCQRRGWMDDLEFMDGIAAAQSCPGPIAINLSIYVGYHLRKGKGMAVAVLGTVIPSLISIIVIAALFTRYAEAEPVRRAFRALKPAVVALIALPMIEMGRKAGLKLSNCWFPAAVLLLVGLADVSPVYIILLTIAFSVWTSLRKRSL
mgnify:CR=1 FL=1